MNKKLISVIAALLMTITLSGCTIVRSITENNLGYGVDEYVDDNGVCYIVVLSNHSGDIAIAPKYNADGTLKTKEE